MQNSIGFWPLLVGTLTFFGAVTGAVSLVATDVLSAKDAAIIFVGGVGGVVLVWLAIERRSYKNATAAPEKVRIIEGQANYYSALYQDEKSIVKSARQTLVVTGSRSRDQGYLDAIAGVLASNSSLRHVRVLFGRKGSFGSELNDHLKRLLDIESKRPTGDGGPTIRIFYVDPETSGLPERFMCSNGKATMIAVQSAGGLANYDTGVLIDDAAYASGVVAAMESVRTASGVTEIEDEARLNELVGGA